jgi:drug/metabolite transporter (DMT)-like permease
VIAYLAFGERADLYTWIGGAVIFASTLYIAYRERAARAS